MTADTAIHKSRDIHPMVLIAAIAVTLFSLAGIAALMGWIPQPATTQSPGFGKTATAPEPSRSDSALAGVPPAATSVVASSVVAGSKPVAEKAIAKPVQRTTAQASPAQPVRVGVDHQAPVPAAAPAFPKAEAAYAPPPPVPATEIETARARPACFDCGRIESVRQVERKGEGSGLGAVAGGVLGGLLGNQTGGGRGRDVMTVVGAVGGAIAGHQIEKSNKKSVYYEVTVRFEDGTTRTLQQTSEPAWRMGDRVRVINSEIVPDNS